MKIKEGEKIPNSKVFIMSKDGPKEISMYEVTYLDVSLSDKNIPVDNVEVIVDGETIKINKELDNDEINFFIFYPPLIF